MPLPAIFAAISAATELFSVGKRVYEEIAGEPSKAQNADQLRVETEALPAEKQAQFESRMRAEIEQYEAETKRLVVEEGELSPELLRVIGPVAAAKIAIERMTTRPKTVRRAMHVVLLPFYVTLYDMAMRIVNNILILAGSKKQLEYLAVNFFSEKSLYLSMYEQAVQPCVVIVLSYMLLRHMQKTSNNGSSVVDQVGGLVGSVVGMFKGKGLSK